MRVANRKGTIWLLAAVLMAVASAGCVVRGRGSVGVSSRPPPPRHVVVVDRPGYVWITGNWVWSGRWVWHQGHYERQRPGQVYVQGKWVQRSGKWHWHGGTWKKAGRGKVKVRDHRDRPHERVDAKRGKRGKRGHDGG